MRSAIMVAILAALTGCDPLSGQCESGTFWTDGNHESPLMRPGGDCIGCHTDSGEGPQYTIAGTVMGNVADVDDCNGLQGVIVRITDANDDVIELETNAAGNFFTNQAVAFPFNAEVELDGVITQMSAAQSDGNCMSCHTEEGQNAAAGRIYVP